MTSPRTWRTRWPLVVAGAAAIVYLALVVPQLGRPLMYDDANFALAFKAVAETGLPFGNQGWMSERGDYSRREQWALWHPPLYIYAGGLLARLGGTTPPVLRLLGILGGLLTAALTYRLAADVTRGPPLARQVAGAIASALVLVCPLIVQSTLIVDIDFPLLLPLTLLFLIAYLRLEGSAGRWLWLVPLFAVMLWAKMTNPLPLVAAIGAWQLLRGRAVRAAVHAVAIGGGGIAIFGATWWAVARALGFPLDMPFGVNLIEAQMSADVARQAYTSPGAFIDGMQPTVMWLGPALVVLGLSAVALRTAHLVIDWRFRRVDLLIAVLIAFVLGYVNKNAGWFPKYQVGMAPLLACVAAPLVAHAWCARPRLTLSVGAVALGFGGLVELGMVRDGWALERTYGIEPQPGAWLAAGVVLAVMAGLRWRAPAAAFVAALVGVAAGWSLGLDAIQVRAPYQTDYYYGTTGTVEAADWVDTHVAPEQTYAAAKEVAIRARAQRYVDEETLLSEISTGRPFNGKWAGEPLHAVVAWQREPFFAALFERFLVPAGFRETARFGDYVVYEPVSSS